ncbi:hypothetical protein [Corallococcus sp. AB038B]|uniref:hypothetical protein n=1 Tax=Corallococcus sp. AB038B TaxID=2316718 RepID=UPI0011C3C993|nr:hypothetical protein [Corallococcus sp. AB038B]
MKWDVLPLSTTDRARFCTAVLLTGPQADPSRFGWKVGTLIEDWRLYAAGTSVVTDRLQHVQESDAHTWFITGQLEDLWVSAVHLHFRETCGTLATTVHRWPDWALFAPTGLVRTFDPHGPGHWVWRSPEAFLAAYDFDGPTRAAVIAHAKRAAAEVPW